MQIEEEITEAEPVVSVRAPRGRHVLQRWVIDRRIDLKTRRTNVFPIGAFGPSSQLLTRSLKSLLLYHPLRPNDSGQKVDSPRDDTALLGGTRRHRRLGFRNIQAD